jgi:hypothetical protein
VLTISRSDITGDCITEYPAATRFIKLPVANYLELLGIATTVNAPQRALINCANSPQYRFICAALARRLGKTYIANVIGQLISLVPGCNVLIISPNYTLSTISFDLQRQLIRHFDLEVTRDNLKDKLIELSNGSTIRMGSLSTIDSCVGRSYDLIIFDEAALGAEGEAAFNVALRPTLDRPGSKAIFISTPRGRNNWFSRFWNRGFSPEFPEWVSLQADYLENSRMSERDVAEARKSMSRAEFQQEYMASFTEFEGQIYNFNLQHLDSGEGRGLGSESFAGCDPGYRDPTAFVMCAYDPDSDLYYVLDEYQRQHATTRQHAGAIAQLLDKHRCEITFIDSAAAQFAADLAYEYNLTTVPARKDVLAGIAKLQTIIESGRLRVAPHCKHVLAMLDQYRWDTKSGLQNEKPVHDQFSHMADALRYAIYTFVV